MASGVGWYSVNSIFGFEKNAEIIRFVPFEYHVGQNGPVAFYDGSARIICRRFNSKDSKTSGGFGWPACTEDSPQLVFGTMAEVEHGE